STDYFLYSRERTTTEIYTLSLHDALPIFKREKTQEKAREKRAFLVSLGGPCLSARRAGRAVASAVTRRRPRGRRSAGRSGLRPRSEEHTSELQSRENLVCRLLLEKKKKRA